MDIDKARHQGKQEMYQLKIMLVTGKYGDILTAFK